MSVTIDAPFRIGSTDLREHTASRAPRSPSSTTAKSRAAASGILNLDTGVEATTDSLFQIGSITKVWTATLAMQLVDEGASTSTRRSPLPAGVPRRRRGRVRSGDDPPPAHAHERHRRRPLRRHRPRRRRARALRRELRGAPQVHPLGATMSYCNTGYSILGRVVEVVTDTVWDDAAPHAADRAARAHPHGDAARGRPALPRRDRAHRAARQELRHRAAVGAAAFRRARGRDLLDGDELVAFAGLHLGTGSADGAAC